MRERSGRQDVPERKAARMGWRGVLVWCPLPMLLLAHRERGTEHFFPRPLTRSGGRGKNVVDVGRGLESEMRSRDDLRRQASTLFPGQRRRSRRANQLMRSATMRKV